MLKQQAATVARVVGLSQRYGDTLALDRLSLDVPAACMVGLIGPDGVGKSSLLSLLAGARVIQEGHIEVLGGDMAEKVIATRFARALPTCLKVWARICIPLCQWKKTCSSLAVYLGTMRPSGAVVLTI